MLWFCVCVVCMCMCLCVKPPVIAPCSFTVFSSFFFLLFLLQFQYLYIGVLKIVLTIVGIPLQNNGIKNSSGNYNDSGGISNGISNGVNNSNHGKRSERNSDKNSIYIDDKITLARLPSSNNITRKLGQRFCILLDGIFSYFPLPGLYTIYLFIFIIFYLLFFCLSFFILYLSLFIWIYLFIRIYFSLSLFF